MQQQLLVVRSCWALHNKTQRRLRSGMHRQALRAPATWALPGLTLILSRLTTWLLLATKATHPSPQRRTDLVRWAAKDRGGVTCGSWHHLDVCISGCMLVLCVSSGTADTNNPTAQSSPLTRMLTLPLCPASSKNKLFTAGAYLTACVCACRTAPEESITPPHLLCCVCVHLLPHAFIPAFSGPEESVTLPHISPAAVMRAYQALQDAASKAPDICRRISQQQDAAAAAAAAEGDSSDDEDQVSMADATNCLHKEPVRLALRLLGHFQPAEQLRAFTHMMQLPGPVSFPSALRDVMGCTYTYRCAPAFDSVLPILCV